MLAHVAALADGAAADGRGVIMSTHDPDQALALNARVLLMKDGRAFAEGPAEAVLTGVTLSAVYGIPVTVETTGSGRKVCLPSLARQSAPTMTSEAFTIA